MNWHLHVTVQPHWSWTLSDVASALARDVERHGVRPIVITNHFRDPLRQPYKELIPTQHFEGDEASAARRIFNLGVLLNNAGWRVRRLKIEGDPHDPDVARRAIYFETHVRVPTTELTNKARDLCIPISETLMHTYATVRRSTMGHVHDMGTKLALLIYEATRQPVKLEIEAAVLDTNPALDNDWINE